VTGRRRRTAAALLALATLWSATGLTAPTAAARQLIGPCVRNTAADVHWIAWLGTTFEGKPPALASTAAWLPSLTKGVPYASIATYVANGPVPSRHAVRATFNAVLHRQPTNTEIAAWSSWIVAHGATALAAQLGASAEDYAQAGGTTPAWLDHIYTDVVGRPIDAATRQYWLAQLAARVPRTTVVTALWNSPPRVHLRLDAIYQLVLHRPVDPAAVKLWSPLMVKFSDAGVAGKLAATPTAWAVAQKAYGSTATAQPPACPPAPPGWVPSPGSVVFNLQSQAARGPRLVALTFDDGPSPVWTPQVLAVLKRYDVPATFFVVGQWAQRYPNLVKAELDAGHHVATHSMTHPNFLHLSEAAQRNEIVGGANVVDSIGGPGTAKCLRPPYGNKNAATVQIAQQRGLATILWSRDGQDWKAPGVDAIVRGNLDTRYDGGRGVLLLHDGGKNRGQTIAALPKLIEALRAQGYQFIQIC